MIAKIFVLGDLEKRVAHIIGVLEAEGLQRVHSDVLYIDSESKLGIEQSRAIKEFFSLRPFQAKGRAVVVEDLSGITVDAQNALLKVLEEPPLEAIILLGTPSTNHLLPTVLSRCEVVQIEGNSSQLRDFKKVEQILELDTEGRFKKVESANDREQLLEEVILYVEQRFQKDPGYLEMAKEVLKAERWKGNNVNVRGILEYLMLVIPKLEARG